MTNPFEKLEDKELAKIGADIIESKNVGGRAESMLPYAKSLKKEMKNNANGEELSLKVCLEIATSMFQMEVLKRYVEIKK